MSVQPTQAGAAGGLPTGELLGRYRTYDDAQKVVDHLAAAEGFDIKALSIVGNDLRSVEHIRTRLSYPRVALGGAAQGAIFGGFIAMIFYLFTPETPLIELASIVLLGAAVWMIAGTIGYAVRKGRRDFASVSQLTATTYDVVCDFAVAGRARQLVKEAGVMSLNAQNDPTGRSGNLGGERLRAPEPSSGTGKSADSGGHTSPQSSSEEQARQRAAQWQTSDGRPRYGVRRDDAESDASAQATVPEAQPDSAADDRSDSAAPPRDQP
ncbi:general stress protein [Nesterenkonia sp. NBAIMH1]|uniref:general stress protein n=1 Tax=Nesterenkonia sp. NBAIMH1 TaxID=2600320 RepID=UPI0011B63459|nr:general stress protein [Nesterenkonia sp. NBAIMH1]